jgi:hypothetical protein
MITNPTTFSFKPSPDPEVQGYNIYIRDMSTGEQYATQSIDNGHLPAVDANGAFEIGAGAMHTAVVAAGKEHVNLYIYVEAYGPGGAKSVEVLSTDQFEFIDLEPPTDVHVEA